MPASVDRTTSALVRYKSIYTFTVPTGPGTFRIDGIVNTASACVAKSAQQAYAGSSSNVLGIATEKTANFLDDLINFFKNLFGIGSQNQNPPAGTTPPPPAQPAGGTQPGGQQLQLKGIKPATIDQGQDLCHTIQFTIS